MPAAYCDMEIMSLYRCISIVGKIPWANLSRKYLHCSLPYFCSVNAVQN